MDERFVRNLGALTEEECALLGKKRVLLAGCGGLGGYLLEYLLRLGVGRDSRERANVIGHVLGKFSPADRRVMDEVVAQAVKAIGTIELESAETAMNRYNGWTAESAAAGKEDDK